MADNKNELCPKTGKVHEWRYMNNMGGTAARCADCEVWKSRAEAGVAPSCKPSFYGFAADVKATIKADWITARVAAQSDALLNAPRPKDFSCCAGDLWQWAEELYVEGQVRGYLP